MSISRLSDALNKIQLIEIISKTAEEAVSEGEA